MKVKINNYINDKNYEVLVHIGNDENIGIVLRVEKDQPSFYNYGVYNESSNLEQFISSFIIEEVNKNPDFKHKLRNIIEGYIKDGQ